MRLTTFVLTAFLLACSGLGTPEVPTAPEVPPPAPVPVAPVLWEVVADPGAAPHPARPFATIKAGSAQGLVVDTTLALVGPAPAVGGPQPVVGSARVTEVGADSARLVPVRLVDPLPASLAARSLLTEDQAALSAIPEVKPGGSGKRPGPAGGPAVGAPSPGGGGAGLEIPDDLRTGSANDREDAVARYESRTDATGVIVWVMKNDPAESVRFKAWRVVRARWKKGIGDPSEHEQAAAWLAANGSKDARLEAIDELGARSRNVERAGAQIDDGDPDIRAAAVKAVYEVGDRTGKRDKAREVLKERRGKESSSAVRSKIDALLGKL